MASLSPLPSVIGYRLALRTLNKKHGFKLAVNDLFLIHMVLTWNNAGKKCGAGHVLSFFRSNGRTKSANVVQADLERLYAAGLVVSLRSTGVPALLNLSVTIQGRQVLAEFERLLSSYKVRGLDV